MLRVLIVAASLAALSAPVAHADFRTGNSWETKPARAQEALQRDHYHFWGFSMTPGNHYVTSSRCKGDLRFRHSPPNWYHRLNCIARLDAGQYGASFSYWQTGKTTYRVTDVLIVAT